MNAKAPSSPQPATQLSRAEDAPPILSPQQQMLVGKRLTQLASTNPQRAVFGWMLLLFGASIEDLRRIRTRDVFPRNLSVRNEIQLRIGNSTKHRTLKFSLDLYDLLVKWGPKWLEPPHEYLFGKSGNQPMSRREITRDFRQLVVGFGPEIERFPTTTLQRTGVWRHYLNHNRDIEATAAWLNETVKTTARLLGIEISDKAPTAVNSASTDIAGRVTATNKERAEREAQKPITLAASKQTADFLTSVIPSIVRPALQKGSPPQHVASLMEYASQIAPDRFAISPDADQALRVCSFKDVVLAAKLIDLLLGPIFKYFESHGEWDDVSAILADEGVFYRNKIVSRSGAACIRTFRNDSWTLRDHLCIGTTADPLTWFYIYFDWDAASKRIVILHAGDRLE